MMIMGFEFKDEKVFDGCKIIKRESSPLVVAKKEIILPVKKEFVLEDGKLFDTIANSGIIL